ncbi:MAG TPA: type IX secretion system sortase PorU [Bacteroidales bacterium]|nr:type IX secretion system sortase PorU [Bacteroidales bacterium]
MMKSVATGLLVMASALNAASQEYSASSVPAAGASGRASVSVQGAAEQEYSASSVLGNGQWVKIAVTEEGIYRLDYSRLKEMGFTDPSSAVLYGNNAGQLSFMNDDTAPDDLKKIAFRAEKGTDGVFNEGDYLLFYAEGTHRWIADPGRRGSRFVRHHYSDTAWYFITSQPGGALTVQTETPPAASPSIISSSTDLYMRHEREEINLIRSGREWYQQVVPGTQNNIGPGFTDLPAGGKIHYTIRVAARSDTETSFILRQGGETIKTITVPAVTMTDINGVYAATMTVSDSIVSSSGSPAFSLAFSSGGNMAATGYIDYADFTARSSLVWRDRNLFISDSRSVGTSAVTRFTVEGSSSLSIWDISNPAAPLTIQTTPSSGNTVFVAATDSLRRFVAFSLAQVKQPLRSVRVPAQNLHAMMPAGMIIVTYPLFMPYAKKLAELHLADDGLTSLIVTPEQVYNEFSGGVPDATALRNFIRMIRERGMQSGQQTRYLLLFGDGSYENKTPPPGNSSFIPTWQSVNSTTGVLSFTSDDFYGLLDDGEGEADGFLDMGIGRLPAYDTASAGIMVRKISSYLQGSNQGSWRNILCLVADDEDSNLHMFDAEGLAEAATTAAPPLTVEKIYLDAYRQMTSVSGDSYPDASRAVDDRMAAGCLIMNYVGHGNESGLAHERVIRTGNINSWKNSRMLPLFITATCEFSRFDDVEINRASSSITARNSAGEMVLLNPDGGGIALMSTTRVVYSAPNYTLNRAIYDYAFRTDAEGRSMRLGDIIRQAKVSSGTGMNKRNFLLLGDPALRLAWPSTGKVVTDSINGIHVSMPFDTLKALSLMTVSGHLEDAAGNLMTGFNGTVEPAVFDKPGHVSTLANDGGSPITFPVDGNVLFRGKTNVTGGRFSFSFIVPLDINYSYGSGSVKYYAYNGATDLNGSFTGISVGGFSDAASDDTEGPQIRLFMNDTLFNDGGVTDASPVLLALLSDRSGINATGTGIGHDIIAWLDDDMSEAVVLNSLFRADVGRHISGSLAYPLLVTGQGKHTVSLRAWDNLNNPTVATLRFAVETGGTFRLTDLLAFPNPVTDGTKFTAGHNRPGTEIDLTITIFSSDGRAMKVLRNKSSGAGYALPDIPWDGCDENGGRVARGLYLWRAEAVTADGEKTSATGRFIIL